jgi:succinate dehydrogenase / fumarate reductase cytochrome b subunit
MKWLLTYISSSIGKKQIMGATGCILVLFVLGHAVGNLQLLIPDAAGAQAAFNAYSALLTKSKLLLFIVEAALVLIFITHLFLAVTLKLQNNKARGSVNYAVNARKGRKDFPTFIMIWTGLLLAAFLVWHLLTLRNGIHYHYINPEVADGKVVRDMWLTTIEVLGNPLFYAFYLITMLLLGFHLWHAISSAIQTMGINHHKWTPIIEKVTVVISVVVAICFATIVTGTFYFANFDEKTRAIIEQSRDASYQDALEALSKRPLDEQRMFAKLIAKNPGRAKLMMERDKQPREERWLEGKHRGDFEGKGPRRPDGLERKHKKHKRDSLQEENTEEEGDEL